MSTKLIRISGALALMMALIGAAVQAQSVTQADIQRLDDVLYDASRDVAQLRGRDASLATSLQAELDELRDEAIYLRVKLRKSEPVTRADYSALREKIDGVRARARGESSRAARGVSTKPGVIPVGTEIDVRLQSTLSSATAQVEDRFDATTLVDLSEGDRVLVPAGSVMRGMVSSVTKPGRVERKGSLTVVFDRLTASGRSYPMRGTVTQALESEGIKGEAERIGAGAGIGAILGGILGGLRGALAGILIGGGGTIAATEGTDVTLPAGTVLRVRLDTPLELK
jgi:hypothetical protein